MKIQIYTDGSCLGNPGPGGWAALIRIPQEGSKLSTEHRIEGGVTHSTNNRMEMQAIVDALIFLEHYQIENLLENPEIEITSDSSLVINTMTKGWKRKKNHDIWENLDRLVKGKNITWHWVKGHAGHPENEDCDRRANAMAEEYSKKAQSLSPNEKRLPGEPPSLF